VACWAHVRRKIYEVALATKSTIATEALERIAQLFAIETTLHGRTPEQRCAARQEQAVPLLVALHAFLEDALQRISGKSSLAKAIRYALSRWQALIRYTTDGRLEMTNNAAERAIRPLALGRNYVKPRIMRSPPRRHPPGWSNSAGTGLGELHIIQRFWRNCIS
jgi:hypothetical protein